MSRTPKFLLLFFALLAQGFAATFGTVTPLTGGVVDIVLDVPRQRLYLVGVPDKIEVYSIPQRRFLAPIRTDSFPLAAALSRDGKSLYVACHNSSSINIIDPDQLAVTSRVSLPAKPEGVAVGLDGRVCGPGEEGEIRVKAPQMLVGYVDPALDADGFDDQGFFRTGDLGYRLPGGHVVVSGRLKDIIIRKGENISAKEVEDVLYLHPKVFEVAVIGLPDAAVGERCCAVVVPRSSADPLGFDEMVEFLRVSGLMMQKIPEQLVISDGLPRAPAGKVLKQDLKRQLMGTAS